MADSSHAVSYLESETGTLANRWSGPAETMSPVDQARTVRVSEWRAALALVLDEAERKHGEQIELNWDFYWEFPANEALDLSIEPDRDCLAVGSLADDIESVRELVRFDGDQVVEVWHDLAHIVGILRAIVATDLPWSRLITHGSKTSARSLRSDRLRLTRAASMPRCEADSGVGTSRS